MLVALANDFPTASLSAISPRTAQLYDVPILLVNANLLVGSIVYAISFFPAQYIVDNYGLKVASSIGNKKY